MCMCCFSCTCMRPRYKRLVDNIFPALPQDGLVKNNMEKLTFYSLSSPEKLDRIGEYLFQRASRDISRRRNEFVVIAMEAMDQLLVACHAQTLNLFVESFLRMVQKLLESSEPHLQVLATQSFVRFANIEEDTPSYHRRYDFFVSKFSSMCHNNNKDSDTRDSIRMAGIKGIQGVIRKTVSDDLVENIWEPVHMDKIVPSLLYNMQDSRYFESNAGSPEPTDGEQNTPPALAETCIRELVGRASFGHVRGVLRPALRHMDLHNLWVPNQFAIHTFRIIMFSIQSQYSYAVVEALMTHLDENSKCTPKIRTSIADVLSKIIAIAAEESVGPSVLEIINSLLTHLRGSVSRQSHSGDTVDGEAEEASYQEALINALGEFAAHLPDYQKIEIMMFIISKAPYKSSLQSDTLLQHMLLKSLLTVGRRYHAVTMNATFPVSFLDPLLRMSLSSDPDIRLLVQRILQTLLDRHANTEKLLKPTINIGELELVAEKCSRSDTIFMRKHGPEILSCLAESLEMCNNTVENIEAVYTTLALHAVELASEDTLSDFLNLLLSIQEVAISNKNNLSAAQRYNLHAIVASLLILLPNIVPISPLKEYAEKVLEERKSANALHLLPELLVHYEIKSPGPINSNQLIDQQGLSDCLIAAGLDISRMTQGASTSSLVHRHSWVESAGITLKGSLTDLTNADFGSANSSPGLQRSSYAFLEAMESTTTRYLSPYASSYLKPPYSTVRAYFHSRLPYANSMSGLPPSPQGSYINITRRYLLFDDVVPLPPVIHLKSPKTKQPSNKYPEEELTFEAMKRVLCENGELRKEAEALRQRQINETFRTTPFHELVVRATTKEEDSLQFRLNALFSRLSTGLSGESSRVTSPLSPSQSETRHSLGHTSQQPPLYEQLFPELFAY